MKDENEKYKNKKPCPNKYIEQFFELLKILPPDIESAPLSVKSTDNPHSFQNAERRWSQYKLPFEQWTDAARWSLYQQLEELPTEFQDYIWGVQAKPKYNPLIESADENFDIKKQWHPTREAVTRYEDFSSLLFSLRVVAKFVENNLTANEEQQLPVTQLPQILPIIGQTRFQLNRHNEIEIYPDELSRALEKVDVTLVRECKQKNCQRLFWAGRADQKCCSAKCRETWKKQRQRDKLKNNPVAVNDKRQNDEQVRTRHKARLVREQAHKRP